eukprot:RCo018595
MSSLIPLCENATMGRSGCEALTAGPSTTTSSSSSSSSLVSRWESGLPSVREYEQEITTLRAENFNLRLYLYHLLDTHPHPNSHLQPPPFSSRPPGSSGTPSGNGPPLGMSPGRSSAFSSVCPSQGKAVAPGGTPVELSQEVKLALLHKVWNTIQHHIDASFDGEEPRLQASDLPALFGLATASKDGDLSSSVLTQLLSENTVLKKAVATSRIVSKEEVEVDTTAALSLWVGALEACLDVEREEAQLRLALLHGLLGAEAHDFSRQVAVLHSSRLQDGQEYEIVIQDLERQLLEKQSMLETSAEALAQCEEYFVKKLRSENEASEQQLADLQGQVFTLQQQLEEFEAMKAAGDAEVASLQHNLAHREALESLSKTEVERLQCELSETAAREKAITEEVLMLRQQ